MGEGLIVKGYQNHGRKRKLVVLTKGIRDQNIGIKIRKRSSVTNAIR